MTAEVIMANTIIQQINENKEVDYKGVTIKGNLNFTTAKISYTMDDISYVTIGKKICLSSCVFTGGIVCFDPKMKIYVIFEDDINFSEGVKFLSIYNSFKNVKFLGKVNFAGTAFNGITQFEQSQFAEEVNFERTIFSGVANFVEAKFCKEVYFNNAQFNYVKQSGLTSSPKGVTNFICSEFNKEANFSGVEINTRAIFSNIKFLGNAIFTGSKFMEVADFEKTDFMDIANFDEVLFSKEAEFNTVTFKDNANFKDAQFINKGNFRYAKFSKMFLINSTFIGNINVDHSQIQFEYLKEIPLTENQINQLDTKEFKIDMDKEKEAEDTQLILCGDFTVFEISLILLQFELLYNSLFLLCYAPFTEDENILAYFKSTNPIVYGIPQANRIRIKSFNSGSLKIPLGNIKSDIVKLILYYTKDQKKLRELEIEMKGIELELKKLELQGEEEKVNFNRNNQIEGYKKVKELEYNEMYMSSVLNLIEKIAKINAQRKSIELLSIEKELEIKKQIKSLPVSEQKVYEDRLERNKSNVKEPLEYILNNFKNQLDKVISSDTKFIEIEFKKEKEKLYDERWRYDEAWRRFGEKIKLIR